MTNKITDGELRRLAEIARNGTLESITLSEEMGCEITSQQIEDHEFVKAMINKIALGD